MPQNIVAQAQSPAMEFPGWAPYVMIGPNDLNDATGYNHILTFGRGAVNANCGLWHIAGSPPRTRLLT